MCGIIGIVGKSDVQNRLVESLLRLEYRGYDSAGVAGVTAPGQVERRRAQGKIRALQDVLLQHRIEIVCLAGFMRLLTAWFVGQWPNRMLNIHPALLPAFKGLDTHRRAIEAGAREHGATVHVVVPEMDSGPIIAQGAVPVLAGDTEATLAARVLEVEHRIYPLALKLVAANRVRVADGHCIIAGPIDADDAALLPGHSTAH